jgi:hypothetical protein
MCLDDGQLLNLLPEVFLWRRGYGASNLGGLSW